MSEVKIELCAVKYERIGDKVRCDVIIYILDFLVLYLVALSGWQYMRLFYIHGSVHLDSILIRSNEMQYYAGVYLLQNYSTCPN